MYVAVNDGIELTGPPHRSERLGWHSRAVEQTELAELRLQLLLARPAVTHDALMREGNEAV